MTTCIALLETAASARVRHVQFGLINPELVKRQSVCKVTKSTLYTRQLPAFDGLNDLRMGTSDRRLPCGTCKNNVLTCVGHPGHIELMAPVFHVSMLSLVIKVLRCVCFFCSRLLVDVDALRDERMYNTDAKDRLNFVANMSKTRHFCRHCEGAQPKYTQMRASVAIKTEFRPKDEENMSEEERVYIRKPFTAAMARFILAHITDEEVELMGIDPVYARPEWMILTVLQVPPPISRPSIMATDGSRARGQDDVTIKLQDIVKANNNLATLLAAEPRALDPWSADPIPPPIALAVDTLQAHLTQFMHHDVNGAAATAAAANTSTSGALRSSRPLRLIPLRLKGKKGRFRGTLGGKRVDYSARTVVSPAPGYDIHEVGVPQLIARHLTYPERVTPYNIKELTQRVLNGPAELYGAVAIVMPDETLIDLTLRTEADRADIQLQPGWVVERYLKDGDWVLFNRQPSLHRMSIMAHQVRVIKDKTFRLPVCDTTPYNADFDGDEMNLHVLRSVEAVAEAQELMSVSTQLISPQNNKPIIGLVQDSLVAAFLMTQRDTFFTRDQVMQLLMNLKYLRLPPCTLPPPSVLKPQLLWTGKQIFSLLFPPFSLDMVVRSGLADGVTSPLDPDERHVIVRHGMLMAGSLCKKTLGTSAGGIVHLLVNDMGHKVAANFISDAQRLLVDYLLIRGFSVGIGDCIMGAETHAKVNASLDRCLTYADSVVANAGGTAPPALMEACLTKLMTGVLTRTGALVQEDLPTSNQVYTMVTSGAKGSAVNIAQILGCVGQQSVEGGRIMFDTKGRTLPCYPHFDTAADSRGFVANSYGTGLSAQEYFFHAMGGREGLVDTAVKTASTGYIQRRLVKSKEGLQVRYDHTVRNTRDQVVQFTYGGDSFDAIYVEKKTLRTFHLSDADVRAFSFVQPDELVACAPGTRAHLSAWTAALDAEADTLIADRAAVRHGKLKTGVPDATVFVTVPAERLIEQALHRFNIGRCDASDMQRPEPIVRLAAKAYAAIEKQRPRHTTLITLAYVRCTLCLKTLVTRRLTVDAVKWLFSEVVRAYTRSLAHPGDMVGTLGASSIGEPCTQMTLNTFHTAGVAEKTVTLGVPRLEELIDTARNIKTPSLTVFFKPPYSQSEKMARTLSVALEYTLLHHAVATSSVEYEPDPLVTHIDADEAMVDAYNTLFGPCAESSAWVIRFVLNRNVLAHKQLTVMHVATALQLYLGDSASVMRSEVNSVDWVVRVRVKNVEAVATTNDAADEEERKSLERAAVKTMHDFLLDNLQVHGVCGITRTLARTLEQARVDPVTGGVTKSKEWVADTDGTALKAVLTIAGVDAARTISNDIHEVLEILGIEAAAHVLLNEIRAVLSFDGSYVNDRHLQLLVDVMTLSGTLTAMTRHSMHKLGGSTYHHASFEETQDVLITAAAFGARDRVSGVTENIMMGMLMPGGTGACDVFVPPEVRDAMRPPEATTTVKPLILPTVRDASVVKPLQKMSGDDTGKSVVKPLTLPTPPQPAKPIVKPLMQRKVIEKPRAPGRLFVPLSPRQFGEQTRTFEPLSPRMFLPPCTDGGDFEME
jgi:DNA-directed RNA polymerase II subunit RPB1